MISASGSTTKSSPVCGLPRRLTYSVLGCSSYSQGYSPENILVDNPTDQASRWSSASNDQFQYLTLKLSRPALIHSITFGKFHKNHVCNLRDFKVLAKNGDSQEGSWIEILHSGLRNDNEPETFPAVYPRWNQNGEAPSQENDDRYPSLMNTIPVTYLKIIPLAAWGNSFNFSIWYVELHGDDDPALINHINRQFQTRLQVESWRLCLKFLRSQPEMESFYHQLSSFVKIPLEDPLVTLLHDAILKSGNYGEAEKMLTVAHQANPRLFEEYLFDKVPYEAKWTRLSPSDPNGSSNSRASSRNPELPPMRGGHQMCFDPHDRSIYLLGGWDGSRDLGDFWYYNVPNGRWTCLSEDTRREGGPGPRSCHKIVLHSALRRLYVLGKYVDTEARQNGLIPCDFYYYDLVKHTWTCLSEDTLQEGGPGLVYDHQMAVDEEQSTIYVFGGRQIQPPPPGAASSGNSETIYSGLFAYHIDMNNWNEIRSDASYLPATANIKSRIGHTMLFNQKARQIIIYAGQRQKDYLSDFYVYDVDGDEIIEMVKDTSKVGGPDAGFTQRCSLDVTRQELFLFSGLMRDKPTQGTISASLLPNTSTSSSAPQNSNSATGNGANGCSGNASALVSAAGGALGDLQKNNLWIYDLKRRNWSRIKTVGNEEPCPRFAHQIVYDEEAGTHYLFGGNPGEGSNPRRRLDDFWSLKLEKKQKLEDILRRVIFQIRKQQFYEICWARKFSASALNRIPNGAPEGTNASLPSLFPFNPMTFLQNDLSQVVNHDDAEESREFQQLSVWLLNPPSMDPLLDNSSPVGGQIAAGRKRLFQDLISFLPRQMRPPTANLHDFVSLQ